MRTQSQRPLTSLLEQAFRPCVCPGTLSYPSSCRQVPLRDLENMKVMANRTSHVLIVDDAEWEGVKVAMTVTAE